MPQRQEQAGVPKELRELKHLAGSNQASAFVCRLQELLLKDFEATFFFVKHQRLINKFRNPDLIAELSCEIEKWLPKASLSGKSKALIKRHMQVCYEFQRLFTSIDKLSRRTSLWRRPLPELWADVLSHIERRAKVVVDSHTAFAEHYGKVPNEYIAASASATRSFRDDCDAALHVLSESLGSATDSDVSVQDLA